VASDGSRPSAGGAGPSVGAARDDGDTVWLAGEHDLATAPRLRNALNAVTRDGVDAVVDLSGTTFPDATTIGVLAEAGERLAAHAGRLVLRRPTPLARRVLTIRGIDFGRSPDGGSGHGRHEAPR
jgi:anti-anti-sigma factor